YSTDPGLKDIKEVKNKIFPLD
ncbi:hypothetical protein LCGC14_1157790, partial [marine sediment metagenome]